MAGRDRSRRSAPLSRKRESRPAGHEEPPGYEIELTQGAEETYRRLYEDAQRCLERGDETNARVTAFRMVEEAINKIIPSDPFNPCRSLAGPLANIFRVKKGRMRICYAGSSQQRRLVVLYISETLRKEGDAHDPYAVLAEMLGSGEFDGILAELGVRRSARRPATESRMVQ